MEKIDYLSPDVPGEFPWHDVPLVRDTADSLEDTVSWWMIDYQGGPLEIVT